MNLEAQILRLNDLIKEYEKQLRTTTKQGRKKIQKTIEELEKEKARIGAYVGPAAISSTIRPISPFSSSSALLYGGFSNIGGRKSMICIKCGKGFSYYGEDNNILYRQIFESRDVYCPFCGANNIPQ